jgi:short-subunit dehydrogenase
MLILVVTNGHYKERLMIRPLALVTGASSGIGAELSVELAKAGHDLILTGRDAGRLEAVAARVRGVGVAAETVALELGTPQATNALVAHVGSRPLAVLVNNAGFGGSGPVAEANPAELESMVALNVTTLTLLTRAFVPGMVERKSGRILNVASTAAFSPVPSMAVYGATKAYVLSFSAALAEELARTGVTVTAVCPGPTHTGFAARASVTSAAAFQGAMSAATVAKLGVKALLKGKKVRVTGWTNQVLAFSSRFSPRSLAARIAGRIMSQGGH